jgi:hypothetical protein
VGNDGLSQKNPTHVEMKFISSFLELAPFGFISGPFASTGSCAFGTIPLSSFASPAGIARVWGVTGWPCLRSATAPTWTCRTCWRRCRRRAAGEPGSGERRAAPTSRTCRRKSRRTCRGPCCRGSGSRSSGMEGCEGFSTESALRSDRTVLNSCLCS